MNPAFEETFLRLFPRAHAVARRILGDSVEAEDAAAEAFARALASWRRVGALPYTDAWILRVTANVSIDSARQRARQRARRPAPPVAISGTEEDAAAVRLALVAALRGLPRRQRDVIALRYLADLAEVDVARCLGVSAGTVKQHAHRGLGTLRRLLGEEVVTVGLE